MTGKQGPSPHVWEKFRVVPVREEDMPAYEAIRRALQVLFQENRDNSISRKRVPFRNRHVGGFKACMRKGNLSGAAWHLTSLGVGVEHLNALVALLPEELP